MYAWVSAIHGVKNLLRGGIMVLEVARSIPMLISIVKMANSIEKESRQQKDSSLNYMEYSKNASLFAKFANTSFSA